MSRAEHFPDAPEEWGPDCPTSPCEGPACPCCGDAAEEALADLPCLGPSCVGCPACDPLALAGRDEVRQVLQRMRGMRAEGLLPTPVPENDNRCGILPDGQGPACDWDHGCPVHGCKPENPCPACSDGGGPRCDWDPNCTGPENCPYHGLPRCYGCGEVADHGASCVM